MSGHSQAYMVTRNSFRKCPTSGLHECGPNGSLDCGMNLRALTAVRDNLQDPTASRRIPENVDELLLGSQSFVFYPMGCTQRTDIHGMRSAKEAFNDRGHARPFSDFTVLQAVEDGPTRVVNHDDV